MENKGEHLVEDACMQKLARQIVQEWKPLGRILGLTDAELDLIEVNNHSQEERNYRMLLHGLRQKTGKARYNKLDAALREVRRADLADDLLSGIFDAVSENVSQVSTSISQRPGPGTSSTDAQRSVSHKSSRLPRYKMEGKPRGKCLILTYDDFSDDETWNRPGNVDDEEKLIDTFNRLGFDVDHERNINSSKTKELIQRMAAKKNFSSFVLFVCSHGKSEAFYASDKKTITIQEIIELFKAAKCKGFAGKPKMFFFNHCLGNKKETMVQIQPDNGSEQIGVAANNYRPNEADFFIVSSTVPGYISWRHKEKGSYFVQHLCDSLRDNYETHHLYNILLIGSDTMLKEFEEVHSRDSNDRSSKCQVPHLETTLTKAVYFVDEQN